jgi:hypothetical protein
MMKGAMSAGLGAVIGWLAKGLGGLLVLSGVISLFTDHVVSGAVLMVVGVFIFGAGSYLSDRLQGMSRHRIYRG